MSLGSAIRILRKKAFYTQEGFAGELRVAPSTVNRWERDLIRPNIKAMKAIKEFCENKGLPYGPVEKEWLKAGPVSKRSKTAPESKT